MINALFMLGSSYNKNRTILLVFIVSWIGYMMIGYNFSLGYIFPIINISTFLFVSISINLTKKNKKVNTILSISSILIWSILIDVICFFMFPVMRINQNLINYVLQGILFNYKYVFINTLVLLGVQVINYVRKLIIKNYEKNLDYMLMYKKYFKVY